ncbi:N6-adenosine-methyltransferase catalytic subunit [Ctenocephalides felis]|uniref:N6-adenosine-methyltransferase catalytic subunit n=1 Tax=Ctenocephalides felis TaxID=7515 RepID=UPI000E6E10A6|nr:N6-adenosine-methyltransferase catalytic subunit [Ctenocephalides felis]
MSDAWEEIQAVKSKRNSLREKLEKRKKERINLLGVSLTSANLSSQKSESKLEKLSEAKKTDSELLVEDKSPATKSENDLPEESIEKSLVQCLADVTLPLPITSVRLEALLAKELNKPNLLHSITSLLNKLAIQLLISVRETQCSSSTVLEVISADHSKLTALAAEILTSELKTTNSDDSEPHNKKKRENDDNDNGKLVRSERDNSKAEPKDIMSLLAMPSIREKQSKRVGEEILELLSKPTAKEKCLAEKFKSQGGAQVMEFCPHGTRLECNRAMNVKKEEASDNTENECTKLHFKKIIQQHTDESLGDCSFLNTCFHMDTCKYVHYEVDGFTSNTTKEVESARPSTLNRMQDSTVLYPPQWVQCDLRYLDMTVLGKFAVIMADPPWDIHMELPYGTMSDDEMRELGVPALQDDGLIFLWVTGRAMELGRECLNLWGYERVDEIIWVKTNQLQRIIRTGRTGHWLNHGKEHCLVGMKGNPPNLNRGLDCDVIVAEVRATSHKPDEIYGMIERLSPGTRKIELFGRPHNVQPNWITLGNQVDGVRLVDPDLIASFKKRYPDGNCMAPKPTV